MGTWSCKFLPSHLSPSCGTVAQSNLMEFFLGSVCILHLRMFQPAVCEDTGQMLCDVWTQPRSNSGADSVLSILFNRAFFFLPQKQLTSIHTPSVLNYDSMHYNSLKAVFLFKYVLSDWRHYEFNLGEDVCSGIHNAIQSCDLFSPCG